MNKDLVQHLLLSPGIVCHNAAIIQERVDFQDWMKVLSQHDSTPNSNLAVGDWVQVLKGTYKGDVGYVAAVENWGGCQSSLSSSPSCLQPSQLFFFEEKVFVFDHPLLI